MQFIKRLQQKAKQLKSEAQVLMIAYKDSRTPLNAKILIGITVGYLLCPIDLIPDFIPVLGLLDDLIIVPLLIVASIKLIPVNVLNDARAVVKDNPERFKKNNWLFAIVVIIIWILLAYLLYRQLKYLWE
jgi:uncharacterized membrane protein YkvA (DUF1232 family)